MLERLWAGWRNQYVRSLGAQTTEPADGQTLFESILATEGRDAELGIVHRGEFASVLLNIYPYGSGHLLVLPNRGVEKLTELTADEVGELWSTVTRAVAVCEAEYQCAGINVGLNQGRAAGAGLPDHLHVHVLPRWPADTNFLTTIAETRVLVEDLAESHRRITSRWAEFD